tara:strand:+ start:2673 stop:3077 length:405 start_codon:yes stop_codon:yes gene_type:complete
MIQAKLIEMFFKALFKHPKIKELFKYKDEPNELDIGFRDLEKKVTDDGFRITAAVDMMKGYVETIDKLSENIKSINKVIDRFDDKLQQIGKIAHPPAIPIKDINEFQESAKNVKWMMGVFNKMKKIPILNSIFK